MGSATAPSAMAPRFVDQEIEEGVEHAGDMIETIQRNIDEVFGQK